MELKSLKLKEEDAKQQISKLKSQLEQLKEQYENTLADQEDTINIMKKEAEDLLADKLKDK